MNKYKTKIILPLLAGLLCLPLVFLVGHQFASETLASSLTPDWSLTPAVPANNATGVSTTPTISWIDQAGATTYNLYIWPSSDLVAGGITAPPIILTGNLSTTLYTISTFQKLDYNTTYIWRVKTEGVFSALSTFTTAGPPIAPAAPTLSTPANHATDVSITPKFTWSAVPGALNYDFAISPNGVSLSKSNLSGSSYTISTSTSPKLDPNTTYAWYVKANNAYGGTASLVRSFTTAVKPAAPAGFKEESTTAGTISGRYDLKLQWTKVTGATGYNVKASSTSGGTFVTIPSSPAVLSGTTETATFLNVFPGTYYDVVTATTGSGSVESSPSSQLKVVIPLISIRLIPVGPPPPYFVPPAPPAAPPPPPAPKPMAPKDFILGPITPDKSTPGTFDFKLRWDSVTGASGYNVKASSTASGPFDIPVLPKSTSLSGTKETATFVGVGPGTYYLVVTATAGIAESLPSSTLKVVVQAAPTAPVPGAAATPLTATCFVDPASPNVGDAVSFTVTPIGGTVPYTYQWPANVTQDPQNSNEATASYTSSGDNSFNVTVTDNKSVTAAASCDFSVSTPTPTGTTGTGTTTPPPASSTPPGTTSTPSIDCSMFSDVSSGDSDCAAIGYVNSIGAMTGNPDGTFQPNALLQRDQIAKIVLIAARLYVDGTNYCTSAPFPDVTPQDWAFQYICAASSEGLVTGYQSGPDQGFYRSARNVDRVEFLAILIRSLGDQVPDNSSTSYSDVPAGQWFSGYAKYAMDHALFTGSTLNPTAFMTRGEVAGVIYNLYLEGKI